MTEHLAELCAHAARIAAALERMAAALERAGLTEVSDALDEAIADAIDAPPPARPARAPRSRDAHAPRKAPREAMDTCDACGTIFPTGGWRRYCASCFAAKRSAEPGHPPQTTAG
jgi:hypothetical protein